MFIWKVNIWHLFVLLETTEAVIFWLGRHPVRISDSITSACFFTDHLILTEVIITIRTGFMWWIVQTFEVRSGIHSFIHSFHSPSCGEPWSSPALRCVQQRSFRAACPPQRAGSSAALRCLSSSSVCDRYQGYHGAVSEEHRVGKQSSLIPFPVKKQEDHWF